MEVSFSQTPEDGIGALQYDGYTLRWNVTAHASEAEKTVTPENPIGAEQTKTQNSLPDILSEGRALSAADLLNPEVFHPDLSIKQPDRSYSLNAAASADIPEADTSLPAGAEDAALAVSGLTGRVEYANALPGTDFTYTLHPGRVKEEIVLHTPSSITSYRTQIEAAGLSPALLEDGSVQLASSDGSIIFDIPAPFMYDADGAYSEEIVVRLEPMDKDTFELIYIPSYTWLRDTERSYPVTIDPTYQATPMMYGSDKTQDTYVYSGSPNSNYYASSYLKVGRNYQSYVRFPTLPDIGSNYIIHSAQLRLCAVSDAPVIRLCRVTGDWSSSGLTWNNQPGATAFLNLAPNGQFYTTYDVGETVCGWYSGKYPNYGFMIQDPGWSDITAWNLYSSDCGNSNVMPGLQICYYAMSNRSLSTGTYFIRNRGTGKYLDVMNGTAANASNVGVNDFSGSLSQQWYVVNHGNGLYSIRSNLNRSYYLDVDGGQDTDERNVQIYADSSRRFRIRWEFNTAYTSISPTFSNTKVLDVYGGEDASRYNTNVQIYPYSRGGNQTWEFEEVPADKPFNSNYPYWGMGARTGTEASNWYYTLLSTYSYVLRHEVVYRFTYEQLNSLKIRLEALADKEITANQRKSLVEDIKALAYQVANTLPAVGQLLNAVSWVQTINDINSSSYLYELVTIINAIGNISNTITDNNVTPITGYYTLRLLKKDPTGGYEIKIVAPNGNVRLFNISREIYDIMLSCATYHSSYSSVYKVAPQYSYYLE